MKMSLNVLALFTLLLVPYAGSGSSLKSGTYCFLEQTTVYPTGIKKYLNPVKILSVSPDQQTAIVRTTGLIGIMGGGFQVNTCDLWSQKQTPKDAAKKIELASLESKGTKVLIKKEGAAQKASSAATNGVK